MYDYLFTDEMKKDFICHPLADAPRFYDEGDELTDVYGRCSDAKRNAFRYCKRLCEKYNGYDFAICSHNSFRFAVNFRFVNPLNDCIMLAVITRYKSQLYFE